MTPVELQESREQESPGTILLIDDEPEVLRVMALMLERAGHRVISTTDSREALSMLRNHPENYDLVFTDQSMPDISGVQLAKKVIALRPDMPLILCTGFSSTIDENEAHRLGFKAFLVKPVLGCELNDVVRRCLEKRPGVTAGAERSDPLAAGNAAV